MGTAVVPGRNTTPALQPAECIFAVAQGHEYADAALVAQGTYQIEEVEHGRLRCRSTVCGRFLQMNIFFNSFQDEI